MSSAHCKKFTPNIFNKIKCSNCFRQKEEHSAEALECNRASRSIARSGYLFVAPDWDFSVPLNRTKRWQRRWFVLYDDGELNYSVDEHPDTVPQGSVDMSQVLEVTGAEQVTGHPHSLALTGPDRVTFVKAASREDARWWAELLAVFPRRHKRNATFPGGRASPSLPQLGRSASPQPPRPRHLSCTGPSPRTNFTTPPLKEEREKESLACSGKDESAPIGTPPISPNHIRTTVPLTIEQQPIRNDYILSSGSPPTRDKLRCEDKERVRRDWRNERFRDIATALTDRSPESSLALPSEGLLHLKKGWLWYKEPNSGEWLRLWWVLCGPTLVAYKEQDEQGVPDVSVEMQTVTSYSEVQTEMRYGFQIQWSGPTLTLSAVTAGIRSNWLQALSKAAPSSENVSPSAPATPRTLLSSDEEYRTASEGGRRDSEDWHDSSFSSPRILLNRVKERSRLKPKLPRCQSRQSTVDSVSTDELDGFREEDHHLSSHHISSQTPRVFKKEDSEEEVNELKRQVINAKNEVKNLELEIGRLNALHSECLGKERQAKDYIHNLELSEKELSQKIRHVEEKQSRDLKSWQRRLTDCEQDLRVSEERCSSLSRELQTKQRIVASLQEELKCANDRLSRNRLENDRLYKKLQELEGKNLQKFKRITSLTDLTDIDLEIDLDTLNQNELIERCLDLRSRFEKTVVEIRALKRELRDSHVKFDELELENVSMKRSLEIAEQENQAQAALMANRVQDLTGKLAAVEKQARILKSKLQDSREKRRSLSLKGRENFSLNKEVEDKVTELEAKIMCLERGRSRRKNRRDRSADTSSPIDDKSLRRIRRKSLDSATNSEPMKLLMRLSSLEGKVNQVNTSSESLTPLNASLSEINKTDDPKKAFSADCILKLAKEKLSDLQFCLSSMKSKKRVNFQNLENCLSELTEILYAQLKSTEEEVVENSARNVVRQLESILMEKLLELEERKTLLRQSGDLNRSAKLEILAEKIAFEDLVINRLQEAVASQADFEGTRLLNKETIETSSLLSKLHDKLKNGSSGTPNSLNASLDYLTQVLTKRLLLHAEDGKLKNPLTNMKIQFTANINYLLDEQKKMDGLAQNLKAKKLQALAECLALETLNMSADESCQIKQTVSATMSCVRKTVNTELVTSEINHVLMRTAQKYEALSGKDQNSFFTFFAHERAILELWSDAVENHLHNEMDKYIEELTEAFESALSKYRRSSWRRTSGKLDANSNALLAEYADIIAHKALLDARIAVLLSHQQEMEPCDDETAADTLSDSYVMSLMDLETYWGYLEHLGVVRANSDAVIEFKYLLETSRGKINHQRSSDEFFDQDVEEVCRSVESLESFVASLGDLMGQRKPDEAAQSVYSLSEVCLKCRELQESLANIKEKVQQLQSQNLLSPVDDNKRPIYFGTEYMSQLESLRSAYRNTISACEESKEQEVLEQLRVLSERVLASLESWHRKTLLEHRDSHNKELLALKQDKEQALAEETQATLAALDAMRKAHEAEVQREVAKFKRDFAREQQNELCELNERLSAKCLEAATLQEQLGSANRQLMHAQQHILQLERPQVK